MCDNELFWEQRQMRGRHEEENGVRESFKRRVKYEGEKREAVLEKLSHTNLTEEIFYRDWQPFLLG